MMSYKECLLFVSKVLTLDFEPEALETVKTNIASNSVDWEDVVRLSSGQFVLPAMYLQFKRHDLLTILPSDLVEYLEEITNMNRIRNQAILDQVHEITQLFNDHEIYPLYLKGTGHLLYGLYQDIGERMVGDIDLLLPESVVLKAVNLLKAKGYVADGEDAEVFKHRHYPRLRSDNHVASVEIHREVLSSDYQTYLPGANVLKEARPVADSNFTAFVPSLPHLLIHNVYNAQLNDRSYDLSKILLRQLYDLWLLSHRVDVMRVALDHGKNFKLFNSYYATAHLLFSPQRGIIFKPSGQTKLHMLKTVFFFRQTSLSRAIEILTFLYLQFKRYISIFLASLHDKRVRKYIFIRLSNPLWYRIHFSFYLKSFGCDGTSV